MDTFDILEGTKIIIFGSTGMLGRYLKEYFKQQYSYEIVCVNRSVIDAGNTSYKAIQDVFDNIDVKKDDLVINCVGIIPQSRNVNNTSNRSYFKINTVFPHILSTICKLNGLRFIHITTDCVFSGLRGNYNEFDIHDETNDYGVSKSLGENIIFGTIIRTSIIGEEQQNKYSLLEWIRGHRNTSVNGYVNHMWNGVTCLQLSKIILQILVKKIFWQGVRHIYSPRKVSKYELACIINRVYELENKVCPFETDQPIDKTLTTEYDTVSLFDIPDLEVQIEELRYFSF